MRDLERKLRTDLTRTILELEAPTSTQVEARRAELNQLSADDLRALLQRLRGKRAGTRGEGTAPDVVIRAMLASEEEWLTMREIADQARALGHQIETDRVNTALANLEFASGRGSGVHEGYSVEVIRKHRPFLYRLVRRVRSMRCEWPTEGREAPPMPRNVTANTITEAQVRVVLKAMLAVPCRTTYHRMIIADCDATLEGNRTNRESVARVYNELNGSTKP